MKAAPKLRERDIQKACIQFMELDGWRAIPMEPISRREWGKGTGERGQPDVLFIRYEFWTPLSFLSERTVSEVVWVEFKSPRGKVAEHQQAWHAAERARGAIVWVAKEDFAPTVEGFVAYYGASGLQRRVVVLKGGPK